MTLRFSKTYAPFDPHEVKDYTRDWSNELSAVSDSIAAVGDVTFTPDAAATAAGLEIALTQLDGAKAIMWLRAADPDALLAALGEQWASVDHTVRTVGGRTLNETLQVWIAAK
ncbi:MAG: hypothetical protein R3362_07650 [Rhodothermales bacterium]|nr:hypothetical protein [Rhodothermales bacterium]